MNYINCLIEFLVPLYFFIFKKRKRNSTFKHINNSNIRIDKMKTVEEYKFLNHFEKERINDLKCRTGASIFQLVTKSRYRFFFFTSNKRKTSLSLRLHIVAMQRLQFLKMNIAKEWTTKDSACVSKRPKYDGLT